MLSYGEAGQPVRGGKQEDAVKVNWDLLERRIASSEKAYQRQIIRRKIDELVQCTSSAVRLATCRRLPALSSFPATRSCRSNPIEARPRSDV